MTGISGNATDEIDTTIELIIAVILSCLSVFLIFQMILQFEKRTQIYVKTDKVETDKLTEDADDPFSLNPFQVVILAKGISQYDHEPVMFLGAGATTEPDTQSELSLGNFTRLDPTVKQDAQDYGVIREAAVRNIMKYINPSHAGPYNLTYTHEFASDNYQHQDGDPNYKGWYSTDRNGISYTGHIRYNTWVIHP